MSLRKELRESEKRIRSLKKETKHMSKMLSKYQTGMKAKLAALQASGEQLKAEHKLLSFVVPNVSSSKP